MNYLKLSLGFCIVLALSAAMFITGFEWRGALDAQRVFLKPVEESFVAEQNRPLPSATLPSVPMPTAPSPEPAVNRTKIRSYLLDIGQRIVINNFAYSDFKVHATGPISVLIGDCVSTLTLNAECHGEIADVVIKDERPPLATGKNTVVITAAP